MNSIELTPAQAQEYLAKGALLLDVREDDEWETGHVKEARHIPLAQIEERMHELPPAGDIVCICRSGRRSEKAQSAILAAMPGRAVFNLTGGILRWVKDGFPIIGEAPE